MAEEYGEISRPLRGLVLAHHGRDAKLLAEALISCGCQFSTFTDLDELLFQVESGGADLLAVSDDALADGDDDRLLATLGKNAPAEDDIIPLILVTGHPEEAHPLARLPGFTMVAKPVRGAFLQSVLRGAMDTRRRVLQLQSQRRDLEDRRKRLQVATNQLATRNLSLADALRAKDRFLATMSHELRTPLNAVLAYAELLVLEIDGPLREKQRKHVERIMSSARHLLAVIGQVLDYAKLNAGQLAIETVLLDVRDEVDQAISLMLPQAELKGLKLYVEPCPSDLAPVLGDRLRVRQIILNLLSNAIKFTEDGEVVVRFRRDREETVSIQISDTGIGISPDELLPLFEDFYQVDNELARAHEGSGLGLAIAKRLALLMRGDLTVTSQIGVGSTFTLILPLPSAPDGRVPVAVA